MTSIEPAQDSIKNDNNPTNPEGHAAGDKESADGAASRVHPQSNEGCKYDEKKERAEQWKVRREILTIVAVSIAAGASIFQGIVLYTQAGTLNGQLAEMRAAGIQADKLIQSNSDLAAAAKGKV